MKCTFVVSALLLMLAPSFPQSASAQTNSPVTGALRDILPGRQKNTVAALEAMPAEKFSFKPTADQMTFGHLVAHMIGANYMFCSKVAGATPPKVEEAKETDSKENLVAALKSSFEYCSTTLQNADDSKLGETTEGFGGKQVTRAWFSLALAGSWADHYAEAAMYLRANGVLPPTAKK
jgi:uncharacterized damage-inducible protein DinB